MEIGEAVKHLDVSLVEKRPDVEWGKIARMRDVLVHRHHDTDFAIVEEAINGNCPVCAKPLLS